MIGNGVLTGRRKGQDAIIRGALTDFFRNGRACRMTSHACAANVLAGSYDNRAQAWGTHDDGCAKRRLVRAGGEGRARPSSFFHRRVAGPRSGSIVPETCGAGVAPVSRPAVAGASTPAQMLAGCGLESSPTADLEVGATSFRRGHRGRRGERAGWEKQRPSTVGAMLAPPDFRFDAKTSAAE
jgi:hypothetical protein